MTPDLLFSAITAPTAKLSGVTRISSGAGVATWVAPAIRDGSLREGEFSAYTVILHEFAPPWNRTVSVRVDAGEWRMIGGWRLHRKINRLLPEEG